MSIILKDRIVKSWYLIQFKKNSHKIAERNLNRQAFKTFLPLQDFTSKNGSRFLTQLKPLFPGYMFVKINLDRSSWHKIKSTIGVSRLICQDGEPKSVPSDVVSSLMSRCDRYGKLLPPMSLKNGDKVAVLSGALANFVATVETIENNKRVWVLMDMMGQLTKVQLASEKLQLLN